ncbi:MAG: hypothetical protein JXR58_05430 [Bacteroidales bacterium]|nr:hypothetical protein [Bacteroidales bacterium]
MKGKGLPEPVYETESMFSVSFYRLSTANVTNDVTNQEQFVVEKIKLNPKITSQQLSEQLSLLERQIKRILKNLKTNRKSNELAEQEVIGKLFQLMTISISLIISLI